jgi:multicomponent Na+:H+ antiporter subunit E
MRFVSLTLVLFVTWLLWSGHYTTFLIVSGFVTAVAIAAFTTLVGSADREGHPIELLWRAFLYWPWLIKEIFVSALDVSAIILKPSLPISPRLIEVENTQDGPVGVVTYANSITLTPGTITIRVDRPHHALLVHALTEEGAEGLLSGDMDQRVTRMTGRT